ncbi:MAG: hypothetical protein ACT4QF_12115 [Sporichthyaceae bacterium]
MARLVRSLATMLAAVFAALPSALLSAPVPAAASAVLPTAKACGGNPTPYGADTLRISLGRVELAQENSPNHVTMEMRIRNRDDTRVCAPYAVSLTFAELGGGPGTSTACQETSFNDPALARGVHSCTAIVTGPGTWRFTAEVHAPERRNGTTLVAVAATSLDLPDAVVLRSLPAAVLGERASGLAVFWLQVHLIVGGLWLLVAGTLAFLAVPRLRSLLSRAAARAIEDRVLHLARLLWLTFAGVLVSGLYLLSAQVAYEAPFTAQTFDLDVWSDVVQLPYGHEYLLLLYSKIAAFGAMAAASLALASEAGRAQRHRREVDRLERDDAWSKGLRTTGLRPAAIAPLDERLTPARRRALTLCVAVLLLGALYVGAAVVGLNYLHEQIGASAASMPCNGPC